MPKLKLTAVVVVAASLACLADVPAAVAGPWIAPLVVGHVIGAAARLATLPIIVAASAVSSAVQPPPPATPAPYWAGYGAPPAPYPSASYYGPPGYYAPQPANYGPPAVGYHGGPQRAYPTFAYRTPPPHGGAVPLPEPFGRYSVSGMRYSGQYGGAVFSRSRGFAHRRW